MALDSEHRRQIGELITLYQLHPEFRDIYVEGPGEDKLLLWFLRECGCKPVYSYHIDEVDIQPDLLQQYALESNNRDRVVALSLQFDKELPKEVQHLTCIADPDFDVLLGTQRTSRYLAYLDYPGIELYGCCEAVIGKCLGVAVPCMTQHHKGLLKNFLAILQDLFYIRAANVKLGWAMIWIDFTRCCKLHGDLVTFQLEKFVSRYLQANMRWADREQFSQVVDQLKDVKVSAPRQRIRGHDFVELLAWYASRRAGKGGNKFRDPEVMRTIIMAAIDQSSLLAEPSCQKLLAKYQ